MHRSEPAGRPPLGTRKAISLLRPPESTNDTHAPARDTQSLVEKNKRIRCVNLMDQFYTNALLWLQKKQTQNAIYVAALTPTNTNLVITKKINILI